MARQAIITKYLGPTIARGSRVKATAQAGSVIVPWDDRLSIDDNHNIAAATLARRFNWPADTWHVGYLPSGDTVYVLDDGTSDSGCVGIRLGHPPRTR